ncbi:hypothetical protein [Microbacterium sediminis]|nr:hypothetical protein [Microbacterium sediminis]
MNAHDDHTPRREDAAVPLAELPLLPLDAAMPAGICVDGVCEFPAPRTH